MIADDQPHSPTMAVQHHFAVAAGGVALAADAAPAVASAVAGLSASKIGLVGPNQQQHAVVQQLQPACQ